MLKQKMRGNSRGMTLIELICAVAILAIISATVGGAMVVATNSYRNGTIEASMQQEAQFTINAIEALIIDATDTVEFVDNHLLKITNVDFTYEIDFVGNVLQYRQYPSGDEPAGEWYLLASNVGHFYVDASDFDTARTVQITLRMDHEGRTFTTAYNITSRNNPDAGIPIELTAVITVLPEVTLEPNQDYVHDVTVTGSADLSFAVDVQTPFTDTNDADGSTRTRIEPVAGGIRIVIGDREMGNENGDILLNVHTTATGPDGGYLDSKPVTVHIRRVNEEGPDKLQFSSFSLVSGASTSMKAGAVYNITATPLGKHLDPVSTPEDMDPTPYVNPRTVKWHFTVEDEDGNSLNVNDYVTLVAGEYDNTVQFRLNRDLERGMKVKAWARAQHPDGANKTSIPYYPSVEWYKTLENAGGLYIDDSELRRGEDMFVRSDLSPQKLVEDEWKKMHPGEELPNPGPYNAGIKGMLFFRWYNEDKSRTSDGVATPGGYPSWKSMTEQSEAFKFNASDFSGMLFMESYTVEVLYAFRYSNAYNGTVYYPASAFPNNDGNPIVNVDPEYIYSFPVNAFSMSFDSYAYVDNTTWTWKGQSTAPYAQAEGCGIGTKDNPLRMAYVSQLQFHFNTFSGASTKKESVLDSLRDGAVLQKFNGTTWGPYRNNDTRPELQVQFEEVNGSLDRGTFTLMLQNASIEIGTGTVYRLMFPTVKGESYADEATGRGIIYMQFY